MAEGISVVVLKIKLGIRWNQCGRAPMSSALGVRLRPDLSGGGPGAQLTLGSLSGRL